MSGLSRLALSTAFGCRSITVRVGGDLRGKNAVKVSCLRCQSLCFRVACLKILSNRCPLAFVAVGQLGHSYPFFAGLAQAMTAFSDKVEAEGVSKYIEKHRVRGPSAKLIALSCAPLGRATVTAATSRGALPCLQYRTKPTIVRQQNASNKVYYVQRKAVDEQFENLFMSEQVGSGF